VSRNHEHDGSGYSRAGHVWALFARCKSSKPRGYDDGARRTVGGTRGGGRGAAGVVGMGRARPVGRGGATAGRRLHRRLGAGPPRVAATDGLSAGGDGCRSRGAAAHANTPTRPARPEHVLDAVALVWAPAGADGPSPARFGAPGRFCGPAPAVAAPASAAVAAVGSAACCSPRRPADAGTSVLAHVAVQRRAPCAPGGRQRQSASTSRRLRSRHQPGLVRACLFPLVPPAAADATHTLCAGEELGTPARPASARAGAPSAKKRRVAGATGAQDAPRAPAELVGASGTAPGGHHPAATAAGSARGSPSDSQTEDEKKCKQDVPRKGATCVRKQWVRSVCVCVCSCVCGCVSVWVDGSV